MSYVDNPFIYVLLNGELNMSPGKAAAQAVHAVGSLHRHFGIKDFSARIQRTVIILEAENQQQMDNLQSYLNELDIPTGSYIDEGVNEISPYSVTALAVGPIAGEDVETRAIFKAFPLFPRKRSIFKR
jgi:peptidyl-tRNA hydrolase